MEDVELIYNMYEHAQWTLYQIQERLFGTASVRELAVAVTHGRWDQEKRPYFERPKCSYNPANIILSDFRVGDPAH